MDAERKEKIRQSLNHVHDWPSLYMFKFIVPTISDKFEALTKVFPGEIDLITKQSSNGKYTSVTIKIVVIDADEVFRIHKDVSLIEGVISLNNEISKAAIVHPEKGSYSYLLPIPSIAQEVIHFHCETSNQKISKKIYLTV